MIHIGDLQFGPEERAALQRVIDSGRISEGPEVRNFENEYADWLGVRHVVATSSGTMALVCGLLATRQLCPDMATVLVPALTFIATANAIVLSGLEPVFADIDSLTFCLDIDSAFYAKYDAIMPVHLFGFAAKMRKIVTMARRRDVPVIEDACEAHGTTYNLHKVGSIGLWSAFSFYIAHSLQAGEMGCVATSDNRIAQLVRQIKAHGRFCSCRTCVRNTTGCPYMTRDSQPDPRFMSAYVGPNAKAMEFQAAIARVQLRKAEENFATRRRNAQLLTRWLGPIEHLAQLPKFPDRAVPMVYPIVLRDDGDMTRRNRVIRTLAQRGVESRPMFYCIPTQQPAYEKYGITGSWPIAERVGKRGFYVGCHQYLSRDDIRKMARVIIGTVKGK